MHSEAGKGDTPRPIDRTKYEEGWERIFGSKKKPNNPVHWVLGAMFEPEEQHVIIPEELKFNDERVDIIGSNGNTGDHYDAI